MHEAQMHEDNCFVTLTYKDEEIPRGQQLYPRHHQLFMKKLRKAHGKGIRFYHCGEYGERTLRPHYHSCLFNYRPDDLVVLRKTAQGHVLYTSKSLEKIWGLGHVTIGELTFESAAYTARYVMKKRFGDDQEAYYSWFDRDGVIHPGVPEYTTMSRNPGLGTKWLDKYSSDVYGPQPGVIINGKNVQQPKFYDTRTLNEKEQTKQRIENKKNARRHAWNNTPERKRVREKIHLEKMRLFTRDIEEFE